MATAAPSTPNATAILTTQPASQNTQPNSAPVTPPAWANEFKDPAVKTWLAGKKYESPEVLASSAYSLEQMYGADKAGRTVLLPKDEADAEGLKAFRAKIGVPENAEGYKLPRPEGSDETFSKIASGWFLETGIPAKAAEALTAKWNEYIAGEMAAMETSDKQKSEGELNALKGEWGVNFDANAELGRRGLREFGTKAGLDDADLKKLETSIGTAKMLKLFTKLGEVTQESTFVGGDGQPKGFQTSVEGARLQVNQITADRAAGKISDHAWRTEYADKVQRLGLIIASSITPPGGQLSTKQ